MKLPTFFLAGILLAVAGCGGESNENAASRYAGSWYGGYESTDFGSTGVVDIRIFADGTIEGSTTEDSSGDTGTIEGSVDRDGNLDAAIEYSGEDPYPLYGSVDIDGRGHLVGDLTQDFGSEQFDFRINLAPD